MSDNYISQDGLEKLKEELNELISIRRPEVIDRITNARELGDLSENAEYHDARDEQSFIEGRIQELENLINNAVLVDNKKSSKIVSLGSTVHATCHDGSTYKYTIVGHSEADPTNGKISHESPLGRAFLGKKVGEFFELNVPAGKLKCKIENIH